MTAVAIFVARFSLRERDIEELAAKHDGSEGPAAVCLPHQPRCAARCRL